MMSAMIEGNVVKCRVFTGRGPNQSLEVTIACDWTKTESVFWKCRLFNSKRVTGLARLLTKGKPIVVTGIIAPPEKYLKKNGQPGCELVLLISEVSVGMDWQRNEKIEKEIMSEFKDSFEPVDFDEQEQA